MATLFDRDNLTFDQFARYYNYITLGVFKKFKDEDELIDDYYTLDISHSGTPHQGMIPHSGRYPYGSGENAYQRAKNLTGWVDRQRLKNPGITDEDLAALGGFKTVDDFLKSYNYDKYVKSDMSGFCDFVDQLRAEGKSDEEIAELCYMPSVDILNNTYTYSKAVWQVVPKDYNLDNNFHDAVKQLRDMGYTNEQIGIALGIPASRVQAQDSAARYSQTLDILRRNEELKAQGITNLSERARLLGLENESTLRSMENGTQYERAMVIFNTADELKKTIDEGGYLDVGKGTAQRMGIKDSQLNAALEVLRAEGYDVVPAQFSQLGMNKDNKTTTNVLVPPGTTYMDLKNDLKEDGSLLKIVRFQSEDGGETFNNLGDPPVSIDSKRIFIDYTNPDGTGGAEKDGLIELRRGVEDISLGDANYAQVRIAVDGEYYLKGMAIHSDNIPDGYDIVFHTNKKEGAAIDDVFKKIDYEKHTDPENPFGASIATRDEDLVLARRHYLDPETGEWKQSAVNIVNEEGDWSQWSKNLASQFLSKQRPEVISKQLDISYENKKAELDEIMSLTNPVIKQELLYEYANGMDKATSTLKAAPLEGQSTRVILPFNTLKDNEIYAPGYENGETVCLVRYPHGGIFEIPELRVNNKNAEAKDLLGNARDAVGITANTAKILSGADFDGDTVIVLPKKRADGELLTNIKSSKDIDMSPYASLRDFDTKSYQLPKDIREAGVDKRLMKSDKARGTEMGKATNLIADLTLANADPEEITRAVKYSMVVIDAKKHGLDWKQAKKDFNIDELNETYRGKTNAGATTLITRASAGVDVGYWTPLNDKSKMTESQLAAYEKGEVVRNYREKTKVVPDKKNDDGSVATWKTVEQTKKSNQMAEAYANGQDAYALVNKLNPTKQETLYAAYANKVHDLANDARKEARSIQTYKIDKDAAKTYETEVASLKEKVNNAVASKPVNRAAQSLANSLMREKMSEGNYEYDPEHNKKIQKECLDKARMVYGAEKGKGVNVTVDITPKEWEAIQAHAVSTSLVKQVINNGNKEQIKEYAMPRENAKLSDAQISLARNKLANGYDILDVAQSLGVSVNTIYNNVDVEKIRHSVIENRQSDLRG